MIHGQSHNEGYKGSCDRLADFRLRCLRNPKNDLNPY